MSEEEEIGECSKYDLERLIYNMMYQFSISQLLTDEEMKEKDVSTLTTEEILNKIREFNDQKPKDVNKAIFLEYLDCYPVSICKREVSPKLRYLIGFHYRLGVPTDEQAKNGAEKTSYDDLSQIFVRSKATISDCIHKTQAQWDHFQQELAKETALEAEANRQLIEERKAKIQSENTNRNLDI